jgi:hypothetical protein
MSIILIAFIVIVSFPAWLPMISGYPLSPRHRRAVTVFTLSSLLQIAFVVGVSKQAVPLDYSTRFAALGVPCCIYALVLKHNDSTRTYKSGGIMLGATGGLFLWLFFVTVH